MLSNKPIVNKFYLYKTKLVKIKKIHKSSSSILIKFVDDGSQEIIPSVGSDILLKRLYTIGELSKIIEKRSDTLRKYEKRGLVTKPSIVVDSDGQYKNWRFYSEDDVYDVIAFFSGRTPGRPIVKTSSNIKATINSIKKKVNNI